MEVTPPLDPFRCAVVASRRALIMRRGSWRMECPVADYAKWVALYRKLRDRRGGQFAWAYAQPVEALEAIKDKVQEAMPCR